MGKTRWLDAAEQRSWRSYLLGSARLTERLERDLREVGLSLAEYEIMVQLSESEEHTLRMSELAEGVHQSRSRLTHTISRMEASGWVERCKAPGDRRGVFARLTTKGYDRLVEIAPMHVEGVRAAFVDVVTSEDFAAIGRAFAAVAEHARSSGDGGPADGDESAASDSVEDGRSAADRRSASRVSPA